MTTTQKKNMEDCWLKTENDLTKFVAQQYQRTEQSLQEDVQTLKNWMKSQPHLPEILDDKMIQNFLTLNKCSVEKTKLKIDMYYTLRSQMPEIFDAINPKCEKMETVMQIFCVTAFPDLTKDKYRVLLFKLLDVNRSDEIEPYEVTALSLAVQEMRLKEDIMWADISIVDTGGFGFSSLTKLTPSVLAKTFAVYEKILSTPLKKLYFINTPPFINTLMAIFKSALKPKLFDRIVVCQDASILQQHFPLEYLPKDYGGQGKSVEELFEHTKVKLRQYQARFDELDKLKVDENLRPAKLVNDEDLGFHGNFKRLDLD